MFRGDSLELHATRERCAVRALYVWSRPEPAPRGHVEYQIRSEQAVVVQADPSTGRLSAVNPFRVNTALFSLEFVY